LAASFGLSIAGAASARPVAGPADAA